MAVDDGFERGGQIGVWFDGIEFAGLDQQRDGCPVCGTGIVPGEEGVFSVQGDGALDGVIVDLDPTFNQEPTEASPLFCDVFLSLAQGGFCRYAGAVMGVPGLKIADLRR